MTRSNPTSDPIEAPVRRRRWRRWGIRIGVALVLMLVAGELFARFYLGLGDPPLMQADATVEYLFKPDQDCRRFGNRIKYNHYSMRSEDFPQKKTDPNELRVLVVGDSVVNGGALTDHAKLATTLLRDRLAADLKRPVVVGNVSAGSWGPPNELAYLKKYGLFDADVLVIVVSSHDYADAPTFEPVIGSAAAPSRKPVLALVEGFERYLLPRLRAAETGPPPTTSPAGIESCLASLAEMIEMGRKAGAKVIVVHHVERRETPAKPAAGHAEILGRARASGVEPVQMGAAFEAARQRGEDPYLDDIHPNATGQRVMADVLVEAVEIAVGKAK
jgi:lysophospholipase L1-like esterase